MPKQDYVFFHPESNAAIGESLRVMVAEIHPPSMQEYRREIEDSGGLGVSSH